MEGKSEAANRVFEVGKKSPSHRPAKSAKKEKAPTHVDYVKDTPFPRKSTNLDERGGLVDPAVSHVLAVYEEESVELLEAAVGGDRAVVLNVHDVDARLAAVPAEPDAELLARLPMEIHIKFKLI